MTTDRSRLAVLGSPIAHSLSPAIHSAAYRSLGLDWTYEVVEITGKSLADFVCSRGPEWRGLSLTMPLKRDILPLLDSRDRLVELTGAANTVVISASGRAGHNTDVLGVVVALESIGVTALDRVQLIGAGATAASILAAVARLGAQEIVVSTRTPTNAVPLAAVAEALGIGLAIRDLESAAATDVDLVVSSLPGGSELPPDFVASLSRELPLFDVAYDPWPTPLAASWHGPVVSGLEMLVGQALGQVRLFVSGSGDDRLDDEAAVVAAMRSAAGLPA